MKRILLLAYALFAVVAAMAQTDLPAVHRDWHDPYLEEQRRIYDSIMTDTVPLAATAASELGLSWNVPAATVGAYGMGASFSPYAMDDFGWRLHEGFNAQFGMSITAGLGKHSPRGVGFGQTAAFAYVLPISKRLSIAAGITAANFDWGSYRRTDVGIGGVIAYQPTDRIRLYLYGQKTFLPRDTRTEQWRRGPFPVFFDQPSSRIGAAAEFKIGENAMIGIAVEHQSY